MNRPPAEPVIRLDHASFGYDASPVTIDLTLQLHTGEIVALLGPNGSGKSTLVRGLLGLNEHLGGLVELLGTPLQHLTDRTRIGYVPQRHTLSGSVRSTVREVVATGRLAGRPWWRRADAHDRRRVSQAIELVGLSDRADSEVTTLSGGQQRRVLIARALAADPEIMLLDEPTAGVDSASQQVLADVLGRLAQTGVTMIVVTHELDALHGIIGRIVAMESGRICFDGSPEAYDAHCREADHRHDRAAHHDDVAPRRRADDLLGAGPLDLPRRRERG